MNDRILIVILVLSLAVAQLVALLLEDTDSNRCGHGEYNNKSHVKNRRQRTMRSILAECGMANFKRAYRMSWASFQKLHHKIGPELEKTQCMNCPNGRIASDIHLSIALRYFAGVSMWDIMISHGVSHSEAYTSIWAVIDAVNQEASFEISYPSSHAEQEQIAADFARKSECSFDNCAGCIDGMLVWIEKPT